MKNIDLNRVYTLLPKAEQQKINHIVLGFLGALASDMGYEMREKTKNVAATKLEAPKEITRRRKRTVYPIILHDRSIPSQNKLVEIYKNGKGAWNGQLTLAKLNYLKNNRGMTFDEIFPYPPPKGKESDKTIVKKTDKNGLQNYLM